MVRVKICGITRAQDALAAARAGADALGFVFYPPSPRWITPEKAESIIRQLPPYVLRVGVFVNESVENLQRIAEQCMLDALQLHRTPVEVGRGLRGRWRIIRAYSISPGEHMEAKDEYADAILLDTHVEGLPGGTGQTFDWAMIRRIRSSLPIILAGGLNPENVAHAIQKAQPYAVDVASGVESNPGCKDEEKMRRFIQITKGVV